MSLYEQVERDMVIARKERDQVRLSTLGLLKSEVVKAAKEPGVAGADDQLVLRVVRKEVRRREEAAQAYADAGRAEAAARERAEARVLLAYLPPELGDDDLERELLAVVEEVGAHGPRDLGAVMKVATARLAGRADGGRIAAVARRLLG
jgi:uncharacterized protein YqeY